MINIARLEGLLERIQSLLLLGEVDNWAKSFEKFRSQLYSEPDLTCAEIRRIYGGSGSFNDVVLYSNGQPLVKENDELLSLKSELYDLCYA